jgi:hypothetical protein
VVIEIKVHLWGIVVALVFSVIGAIFVIMSGYGEFIYLIILIWIIIPVVIAKIFNRVRS